MYGGNIGKHDAGGTCESSGAARSVAFSPSSPSSSCCCSRLCNFSLGFSSRTPTTFYRNDWPLTCVVNATFRQAVLGSAFAWLCMWWRNYRKSCLNLVWMAKDLVSKRNSRPTLWVRERWQEESAPLPHHHHLLPPNNALQMPHAGNHSSGLSTPEQNCAKFVWLLTVRLYTSLWFVISY